MITSLKELKASRVVTCQIYCVHHTQSGMMSSGQALEGEMTHSDNLNTGITTVKLNKSGDLTLVTSKARF